MSVVLPIGGLEPLTTVDFPGRLAAVVFCQGCPWRCPYCHNRELQAIAPGKLGWGEVMGFLLERQGFLDGVVFSGGEPTIHRGLLDAVREAREAGFAIGLHTAGMVPGLLGRLLPYLEWVGFDVKAPLGEIYDRLVGRRGACRAVRRSLEMLRESGVRFTIRCTVDKDWLGEEERERIVKDLAAMGLPEPVWQACRKGHFLGKSPPGE